MISTQLPTLVLILVLNLILIQVLIQVLIFVPILELIHGRAECLMCSYSSCFISYA